MRWALCAVASLALLTLHSCSQPASQAGFVLECSGSENASWVYLRSGERRTTTYENHVVLRVQPSASMAGPAVEVLEYGMAPGPLYFAAACEANTIDGANRFDKYDARPCTVEITEDAIQLSRRPDDGIESASATISRLTGNWRGDVRFVDTDDVRSHTRFASGKCVEVDRAF
jgi:hypothetical protein